jgi:hypothetical protein
MRFVRTTWAEMPLGVRKTCLRLLKVFPSYDWDVMRGWDWFEAFADRGTIYAVNRSGDWYKAKKD